MPHPTANDNYSLHELALATGATPESLGYAAGSTVTPIDFQDFTIDSVTAPTINVSSLPYGSDVTVTTNYTVAGPRFLSKIGSRPSNYSWTSSNFTLISDFGYYRVYRNAYAPAGNCSQTTTSTIAARLYDQDFNAPATNYNVFLATGSITQHSPPQPTIVVNSTGTPPRPCNTSPACPNANCRGATITVTGNAGIYQGVPGGGVTHYINNALKFSSASSPYTVTHTRDENNNLLCGNTTFTLKVANSYGCTASTTSTTPAYV
jgi:hypothetical protein